MNFKLSLLSFVMVLFSATIFAADDDTTRLTVVKQVCKSRYSCLDKHGQYNANITKNYELRFKECRKQSLRQRKNTELLRKLSMFYSSLSGLCNSLKCYKRGKAMDAFECYIKESAAGKTLMFDLNTEVAKLIVDFKQSYKTIDNTMIKCTAETKEMLQRATLESNQHLTECLASGLWTLNVEIGKFPPVDNPKLIEGNVNKGTSDKQQSTVNEVTPEKQQRNVNTVTNIKQKGNINPIYATNLPRNINSVSSDKQQGNGNTVTSDKQQSNINSVYPDKQQSNVNKVTSDEQQSHVNTVTSYKKKILVKSKEISKSFFKF